MHWRVYRVTARSGAHRTVSELIDHCLALPRKGTKDLILRRGKASEQQNDVQMGPVEVVNKRNQSKSDPERTKRRVAACARHGIGCRTSSRENRSRAAARYSMTAPHTREQRRVDCTRVGPRCPVNMFSIIKVTARHGHIGSSGERGV